MKIQRPDRRRRVIVGDLDRPVEPITAAVSLFLSPGMLQKASDAGVLLASRSNRLASVAELEILGRSSDDSVFVYVQIIMFSSNFVEED